MPESVQAFIDNQPAEVADILRRVRSFMRDRMPDTHETKAWGGIGYTRDDGNYVMNAYRGKQGVDLMIFRGMMLKDPKNRLRGSGDSTRTYAVPSAEDLDPEYLASLLDQQRELFDGGVRWKESG